MLDGLTAEGRDNVQDLIVEDDSIIAGTLKEPFVPVGLLR